LTTGGLIRVRLRRETLGGNDEPEIHALTAVKDR
jgi:hypothetical protein